STGALPPGDAPSGQAAVPGRNQSQTAASISSANRRSVADLSSSPGPWVRHRTRRSGPLARLRGAGSPIDRQSSIRWLVPDRRAGVRAGELRAAGVDGEGAALGGVARSLSPARPTAQPDTV